MDSLTLGAAGRPGRSLARSPLLWGLASVGAQVLGVGLSILFLLGPILAVVTLILYRRRETEPDRATVVGAVLAIFSLFLTTIVVPCYLLLSSIPPND